MRQVLLLLSFLAGLWAIPAHSGMVTVGKFLQECSVEPEPCMAFVLGVVEGARHQTRENLQAQPYSFRIHGKAVCLPEDWGSVRLTRVVIDRLTQEPSTHRYSAVSGVLYALSQESGCTAI